MEIVGYKLIDTATNAAIQQWGGVWGVCPGVPNPIVLPTTDVICAPALNTDYSGYVLIPWTMDAPPVNPVVPGLAFLERFTDDEYAAILAVANTNVRLARWMDMVRLKGDVDVSSQASLDAKAFLVANGLLTQERADLAFSPAN